MISELNRASGQIFAIIADRSSDQLSVEELRSIFSIACETLKLILDPKSLARDLKRLQNLTEGHEDEIDRTLERLDEFAKFLGFEQRLLVDAGINQVTCGRLQGILESVRKDADRSLPKPEDIIQGIKNLQQIVCKIRDNLATEADNAAVIQNARGAVIAAAKAVAGVGLIAANASAAVPSAGFAAVSVILGWEPIKSFLKRFW